MTVAEALATCFGWVNHPDVTGYFQYPAVFVVAFVQFWCTVVGAGALGVLACVSFVRVCCAVSDWIFCEGRWTRCKTCGARTKEDQ